MNIADQLETHALEHALIISRQIDYLGKMPSMMPKPVRTVSVFCADVSVPGCLKLRPGWRSMALSPPVMTSIFAAGLLDVCTRSGHSAPESTRPHHMTG
jgi:hypothetical protein